MPIDTVLSRFGVTIVDTDPADPPPSNLVPVASFTVSCTGLTCSFDGSGSSDPDGSITSYVWDFGDGGSGSGPTTAHAYASAGARTVALTVTDNDGATDTETGTASPVDPPPSNLVPVASFTVSCTGLTCSFDGSGSSDPDGSITSYVWDFGDGGIGSGPTTAHGYAAAGVRTVALTVTDNDGATDTETGTASPVGPPPSNLVPVASFTVSCAGLTCRFDGSGSLDPDGSITSYGWDFGDGGTGNGRVAEHAYASGGDRTVTLTVTDNSGATGTAGRVVDPANPPPPDQPPPDPTGPGASVGLVDPAQGLWSLPEPGVIEAQALDDSGRSFYFGNPGDTPMVGDWDCDGDETPGMHRRSDGFVYLRNSNTQGIADIRFFFGNPSDVPLAGDFNGDGCHTVSIYRPSEQRFYLIDELGEDDGGLGAASSSFFFGNAGDTPVIGDWDGDGIDEVGLYRESTGLFYWRNTLTTGVADGEIFFGDPGDRFVAGDWGLVDGRDTPAVFRPADQVLYFRFTLDQGVADAEVPTEAGPNGLPVAGTFGLG
jgi:PKD repeat protein